MPGSVVVGSTRPRVTTPPLATITIGIVERLAAKPMDCIDVRNEDERGLLVVEHTFTKSGDDPSY